MRSDMTLQAASRGHEWIFSVLSLDLVRGFYDLMGLDPAFHERIHAGVRAAILTTRKELAQQLTSPHAQPADFDRNARDQLGSEAGEHLSWWLQHVFEGQSQDHRELGHWTEVLVHCHREGDELWSKLPFPQALTARAFERFAEARNFREYYRRADALDDQPFSDWDLHMHASQLYDFSQDREGPGINPMTQVSLTVDAYQYLRFFAWLLRELTPEQQTALRDKALEIAIAEDIAWFDKLVHPSAFAVGL